MAKFKSISIASVVISSLSSSVNAWIDSNIGVNLSYPPLENYGNSITNGQVLPNSTTDITGWPCHSWPLPASNPVLRVPFFTSGRVTFALKNDTVGSQQGFDYSVYPYIGEIGFGNGTYTVPSLGKANGMQEGYYFDGATGYSSLQDKTECFQWDMPKAVTRALGLDKPLTAADLVGMEATIGVRIVSAGPAKTTVDTLYVPNAVEEMYQCGYITFTDKASDMPQSNCNSGGDGSAVSTTGSTAPTPSSLEIGIPHGPSGHHVNGSALIGIGVGVALAVILLIGVVVFLIIRRRRAQKQSGPTIAPDVMVFGPASGEVRESHDMSEDDMEKAKKISKKDDPTSYGKLPEYKEKNNVV